MNNRSSSIVNRHLKSYFVIIAMRIFMIFIKFITLIIKFVIIFPSLIFSNFIKMRVMRKRLKYDIIQKILNNYKDIIISNLHDLSFDFLIKIFIIFIFFINHINKFDIFEFIIYE